MYNLLKLAFDICLFRKGPQDMPCSNGLFRLLLLLYAITNYLILTFSSDGFTAILQVLVEIMLILGISWFILSIAKKTARFLQTTSTLLATDAIISFISLPAMATLIGQGSGLAFIFIVMLTIWHWVVTGYIFSHALEKPLTFGLGVAFMTILTSYQVMAGLFPQQIVS